MIAKFFRCWRAGLVAPSLLCTGVALAQDGAVASDSESWERSITLQSLNYATHAGLFGNSLINPDNTLLKIGKDGLVSDTRLDISLQREATDLALKPRLIVAEETMQGDNARSAEAYLSQGFIRHRVNAGLTLTAGRELLTWGPASLRSPSNPYYYDAGKTRPLDDVPGIDVVRADWSSGRWNATAGYVQGGRRDDAAWRRSLLLKAAYRGEDFVIGGVFSKPRSRPGFIGGYAQLSLGEAWIVYGEAASIASPVDAAGSDESATAGSPKPAHTNVDALGAAYTFDGGVSLTAEYLHDGRGYGRQAESDYFSHAAEAIARYQTVASDSQASQSRLIGRNYAYLLLQSDLQDPATYWRASWTGNLGDRSQQLLVYGERSLTSRISIFSSCLRNLGGRSTEFGSVLRYSAVVGFKLFLL